jgi:hypothetical protein
MTELPPGIYFGLDEAAYHAAPALSNSGIKNLLTSPMDFWARCAWLNPAFETEEKDCFNLGKAYDTRITEGKDAFDAKYAGKIDPADYPDALVTADDLRGALADLGEKRGGNKAELIARIEEAGLGDAVIWDRLVENHEIENDSKTLLSADLIRKIEIAAAMIEKHPQLSKAFTGGYPQVSIFWTCEETGCPMKMRSDYLKTRAVVDLKTFANPFGKPIDRAVTYAMASYKYHIQAAVYQEGIAAAKAMFRAHGPSAINGEAPTPAWIESFAASEEHAFLFLFQQTGVAPVTRGYEFPKGLVYDCGKVVVREMKETYMRCLKTFGADPWIDTTDIRLFDDSEFPVFITE